jgi:VanZ family protein
MSMPLSRGEIAVLAIIRLAAWIVVLGLILLSVVPPSLRPESDLSHNLEHLVSFFLAGILWHLAYSSRLLLWLGVAVLYAGGIELLQLLAPGRHARFTDFVVDALGAWSGILVGSVATHTCQSSGRVTRS